MSHEILYVKIHELDKRIGQLHSRVGLSDTARPDQLKSEIETLRKECAVNELALRNKLRFSRAGTVAEISKAYEEIEQIIKRVKAEMGAADTEEDRRTIPAEEKILLAEYALDFALQAADYTLLIALEAIQAQMTEQENEWRNDG